MAELITLEGDREFPLDTDIISVRGKFYPKESIDGQLFGTLVVDSSIVKYPYTNQLNGSDMEDISLNGDLVIDGFSLPIEKEIYPDVTLSGDEFLNGFSLGRGLGRSFGGLSKGLSSMGRGLSRSRRSLSRGLAKSTQSVSKGLSRTGQSLSRGVSAYGKSLGKFYSGIGRGLGRAGT
ncbi:MAG: hypothetical protein HUU45_14250 [Leptospiraceae bacterium]|nr:hypothetical protein [Leptospiraceae bacterium]